MPKESKFHRKFHNLPTEQLKFLRNNKEYLDSLSKEDQYKARQSLDGLIRARENFFYMTPASKAAKIRNFAIYRLEGAKGLHGMIYELSAHGLLSAEEISKLSYGFDTIKLGIDSVLETLREANERLKKESKK